MATTPPIRIGLDPGAADQLRALIQSLAEALEAMTECARMATTMATELAAVNTMAQATTEVLCQTCGGTGLADGKGGAPAGADCPTCMGGGTVAQVVETTTEVADKLTEAMAKPLDAEILTGGPIPAQREPDEPGFTMPTMPRPQLCPECRQGKFVNCTKDGVVGEEPCSTWAGFLAVTHAEGTTWALWLQSRGLA